MVLANQDLENLSTYLQIGLTPVIISPGIEWLSLDDWQNERKALNKEIEEWRTDWESRDTNRYIQHYSSRFKAEKLNLEDWKRTKHDVNAGKTWVKVELKDISMFRNPGKDDFVEVTFEQNYSSNNLNNVAQKRQYWVKEDGQWKIIYEGTA